MTNTATLPAPQSKVWVWTDGTWRAGHVQARGFSVAYENPPPNYDENPEAVYFVDAATETWTTTAPQGHAALEPLVRQLLDALEHDELDPDEERTLLAHGRTVLAELASQAETADREVTNEGNANSP